MVIQDNLSPEKHIDIIFDDSFMREIITSMIGPKLEFVKVIWFPHKKKYVLKLERIQKIATKLVPELNDLTYEARLKEMQLSTFKEKEEA